MHELRNLPASRAFRAAKKAGSGSDATTSLGSRHGSSDQIEHGRTLPGLHMSIEIKGSGSIGSPACSIPRYGTDSLQINSMDAFMPIEGM
jgi:hypothetical protein